MLDNAAYSANDKAKAADSALSPAPATQQPVEKSNWIGEDEHYPDYCERMEKKMTQRDDCRHIFGNMADWPRPCMTCGKDESTIQAEKLAEVFQPKAQDECREAFEHRFADKHTEEEFATFRDGFYRRGHINADWIAFQKGWNSKQPEERPLGYCRDDIQEIFKTGGGEFRVVTARGGAYNTPLYMRPPMRESGWQPIETAPKDGTRIRLWNGNSHADGYWDIWERDERGWPIGCDENYPDQWLWCGEGFKIDPLPTHWMPLPQSPAQPRRGPDNVKEGDSK